MYVMMPTIYQVAYNNPMWDGVPTKYLAIRDNLYGVFLISGIIAFAVSILWGFSAAQREVTSDYSDGGI